MPGVCVLKKAVDRKRELVGSKLIQTGQMEISAVVCEIQTPNTTWASKVESYQVFPCRFTAFDKTSSERSRRVAGPYID